MDNHRNNGANQPTEQKNGSSPGQPGGQIMDMVKDVFADKQKRLIAIAAAVLILAIIIIPIASGGGGGTVKEPSPYESLQVGDVIQFGESQFSSEEETNWIVLAVQEGKALITSELLLNRRPFHSETGVTWETSEIREYLNGRFYEETFAAEEKKWILTSDIITDGVTTSDKVFLLTAEEVEQYLPDEESRIAGITYSGNTNMFYWLRSPGLDNPDGAAMCVNSDGTFDSDRYVGQDAGVRPALWLTTAPIILPKPTKSKSGGGDEANMETATYEYDARNIKVSVTYPEDKYAKSETPREDAKTDNNQMVIVGENVTIEFRFMFYLEVAKSFEGHKAWIQDGFKSSYQELTVNGREAICWEPFDMVYMTINVEDLADTTKAENVLCLRVSVVAQNEEEAAKDYFETQEIQDIINSITAERIDPDKPLED
ncbi:MAG: DUF6273 domain-containing protein [Oscillospiraceae bacterium]|nr:DUF6273 domain-containing protein [Oscillospiraceae bacterium]